MASKLTWTWVALPAVGGLVMALLADWEEGEPLLGCHIPPGSARYVHKG